MSFFKELKRRNVFRVGIAYTVATWLLIQVTDTVFPRIGLPDSAVTLVIALLLIGFLPALILAWAFEMTPDGIKLEKDIDRSQSITPKTGKSLDRVIIAGLAFIIIGMGVERVWFAEQENDTNTRQSAPGIVAKVETDNVDTPLESDDPDQRASVAVLPFAVMSSGEDDGYFADGLTEEILNSLTALPELLVTARTSSFHFKDKNLPIPEIAAILGVDHVVEGSVRRSGDRVRITAQLIRADDGFHLWSNTYDRTLEDVFAVQEDIAGNIAETLDVVLNDDKREMMRLAGIGNVEAFIAYQKGIEARIEAHSTSDPGEGLPLANQWFDKALAIVPGISNAYFESTDMYGHIIYNNAIGRSPASEAELESALAAILNGLKQAARYTQSEGYRAMIESERAEFSDDWSPIPAAFDRAFKAGGCFPSNWSTSLSTVFGWAEQTADYLKNLMQCDPMNSVAVAVYAQALIAAGQPELGLQAVNRYLSEVGFNPWVDDMRFVSLLATGNYGDDPSKYDANPEGSFFHVPRRFYVHAMDNEIDIAREILDQHMLDTEVDDMALLLAEAVLGNRQAANAYASKLDARFAGPFILAEVVKGCLCGAPFDLDATPNFKARIEQAGFNWPPVEPLKYPAKDW